MADSGAGANRLDRWLAGGLVAGAALLFVIVMVYGLGSSTATGPSPSTAPESTPAGNALVGKSIFDRTCGGCHMQAGTADGGVGPKLKEMGLTKASITNQIEDGGGAMPGGLLSGRDLQDVVAYILSLQR